MVVNFNKLLIILKNPKKIVRVLGDKKFFNWLPDRLYLKLVYWAETGKKLNLKNPQTFNEKLQWLKLYDRNPLYIKLVDKYEVRKYIAETIGKEYLIPLIGVYNNVEEIDWESLPNQFVLKCTHGSGANIICSDKSKLDIEDAKKKLKKWMKKNWFWFGREWPYKNVKPRIICEKFISDKGYTPDDYKVLCFNGKARLIEVHIDRYTMHKQDFYDIHWNKTNISQGGTNSNLIYEKPKCLKEMINLSEKLASDMFHVRIDWYIVKGKLYFGEITFYDGSGFTTFDKDDDDYLLGSWLKLPNKEIKYLKGKK